jgi:hypothetical protein
MTPDNDASYPSFDIRARAFDNDSVARWLVAVARFALRYLVAIVRSTLRSVVGRRSSSPTTPVALFTI